jgi:inosine/xanthosine triphosphate pyrophosphatase family protein/ribosomal protein S18 acetylase RimI-like enzyme
MTPKIVMGKNKNSYTLSLTNYHDSEDKKNYLKLINDIENVDTDNKYFSNDNQCDFKRKDLSFVICKEKKPVCLLIAYYKLSGDQLPMDTVYIHRLVTDSEHRRNGLAERILNYAIEYYFKNISWLQNISIQVTSAPMNVPAINLYNKLGFKLFGEKKYHNKIDKILVYRRVQSTPIKKEEKDIFNNPRLFDEKTGRNLDLTFYFSTSSEEKKKQFSWLFSLYNLKLEFYDPPAELIEPQVDNIPGQSLELLVRYPIKNVSRFIKKMPFFVEDTSLFIEEFNADFDNAPELPGLDTKRWWRQLKNEGVLKLLRDSKKRRAKYVSQIGCYFGKGIYVVGKSETNGHIAYEAKSSDYSELKFPRTNPWFFHQIFIPNGYEKPLSLLDQQEFTINDYRRKALEDLLNNISENILKSGNQKDINFNE